MIRLTTNDKKLLRRAGIAAWEDPTPQEMALERTLRHNVELMAERDRLREMHARLVSDRDRWYRCCRRAVIVAVVLALVSILRELLV